MADVRENKLPVGSHHRSEPGDGNAVFPASSWTDVNPKVETMKDGVPEAAENRTFATAGDTEGALPKSKGLHDAAYVLGDGRPD